MHPDPKEVIEMCIVIYSKKPILSARPLVYSLFAGKSQVATEGVPQKTIQRQELQEVKDLVALRQKLCQAYGLDVLEGVLAWYPLKDQRGSLGAWTP